MGLQEAVEVLPGFGDPVHDLDQVIAAHVLVDLCFYQLAAQEAAQEALDWLGVVGAQHPPVVGHRNNSETKGIVASLGCCDQI